MTSRSDRPQRWAPWWAYIVPIGVLNVARQIAFPPSELSDAVNVASFVGIVGAVVALVTAAHHARR
jgi:hypothetical protein